MATMLRGQGTFASGEALVGELLRSGVAPRSCVYVSTPITTGPGVLEVETAREDVLRSNIKHARKIVRGVRRTTGRTVIDPTALESIPGWDQPDYHSFWLTVIRDWVSDLVFCTGWQYSTGCCIEFTAALSAGIAMFDESLRPLSPASAVTELKAAIETMSAAGVECRSQIRALDAAEASAAQRARAQWTSLKDARLAYLADSGANIARFVSVAPNGDLRFQRIARGLDDANSLMDAVAKLFALGATTVNLRTFTPDQAQGNPFIYGVSSPEEAAQEAQRLCGLGYHVIVNETINVSDGGVSGVIEAGVCEFAPDATPRVVERVPAAAGDRVCQLDVSTANRLFSLVYGATLPLATVDRRIEFSIHPEPAGYAQTRLVIWEDSPSAAPKVKANPVWPNAFSRHVGDKAFGLLLGHLVGAPVPKTLVVGRRISPFTFGRATGSGSTWLRTAPRVPMPGLFTTSRVWTDPFELLQDEDPDGSRIASVLVQEGVRPLFSGATVHSLDEDLIIEGVAGTGDRFMLGQEKPSELPARVTREVAALVHRLEAVLGSCRIEWVFDGDVCWLLQLHITHAASGRDVVVPGEPQNGWIAYDPSDGLDRLRLLVAEANRRHAGIKLTGSVGVTSHVGDILRKSGVPSRIDRAVA